MSRDVPRSHGSPLDESLQGIENLDGTMTLAGFGSLLSVRSARHTFPDLQNFRQGRVRGFRRIFAHTASVFFQRKIARPETGEISSLSCEECPGQEIVVTLFEIPYTPESIKAYVEREHEFRFLAVEYEPLDGKPSTNVAVLCGAWNDNDYKRVRCGPEEWETRYGRFGIQSVWRDDVLPCRAYLRHCVLAAQNLGSEALDSFLDNTFLADRSTTIRSYLQAKPDIMQETLPPDLAERYGG